MKRLFSVFLIVALSFLVFFVPSARASTTVCGGIGSGCYSHVEWGSISDHGALTTVEVTYTNYSGSDSFERFMELNSSTFDVYAGEQQNVGICSGTGLQYFIEDASVGTTDCFSVPSGDYNNDVTFKISYYLTGGPGFFYWITDSGGTNFCTPAPCTYTAIADSNASNSVTTKDYVQDLYFSSSFTGHKIWGTDWINNEYFKNGAWSYVFTSGSIKLSNSNGTDTSQSGCGGVTNESPPQMCWHSAPNGGTNNGGTLYSCDYDSTTNDCTIGS